MLNFRGSTRDPETNGEFTPENGCLEDFVSFPFGVYSFLMVVGAVSVVGAQVLLFFLQKITWG